MMRTFEAQDAPSRSRLKLSEPGLMYQTCATPSRYERASLSSDLTILNALSRDDKLRREYVRRRWYGTH
jgi:hypothetical protein